MKIEKKVRRRVFTSSMKREINEELSRRRSHAVDVKELYQKV